LIGEKGSKFTDNGLSRTRRRRNKNAFAILELLTRLNLEVIKCEVIGLCEARGKWMTIAVTGSN
jgi:hypothetical protein